MALITEAQRTKLTANWTASKAAGRHLDHFPVARLKSELGQHVLLTEMNSENLDHSSGWSMTTATRQKYPSSFSGSMPWSRNITR